MVKMQQGFSVGLANNNNTAILVPDVRIVIPCTWRLTWEKNI